MKNLVMGLLLWFHIPGPESLDRSASPTDSPVVDDVCSLTQRYGMENTQLLGHVRYDSTTC